MTCLVAFLTGVGFACICLLLLFAWAATAVGNNDHDV